RAARAAIRPRAGARHTHRFRADRARQRPRQRAVSGRRWCDREGDGRVDVLVRGRLTTLRPAGANDADRLVAWHADPEVSRYWDGETFTPAEMEAPLVAGG